MNSTVRKQFSFLIFDENFIEFFEEQDKTALAMLSRAGVSFKRLEMKTNATEIREQIEELKRRRVNNIMMLSTTLHAEAYTLEAKKEMETKKFQWFYFSKDVHPFQCEICQPAYLYWVRPMGNENFNRVKRYKEWLRTTKDIPELVGTANEVKNS